MKKFSSPFQVDSGELLLSLVSRSRAMGSQTSLSCSLSLLHCSRLMLQSSDSFCSCPLWWVFKHSYTVILTSSGSQRKHKNLLNVPPFLSGVWRHLHLSPLSGSTTIIPVPGTFIPMACFLSSAVHQGRHRAGLQCLLSPQHLECMDCEGNRHRELWQCVTRWPCCSEIKETLLSCASTRDRVMNLKN